MSLETFPRGHAAGRQNTTSKHLFYISFANSPTHLTFIVLQQHLSDFELV